LRFFGHSLLPSCVDGGKYVSYYWYTAIKLSQARTDCSNMAKRELPILQSNGQSNDMPKKPRLKYDCTKCPAYCCTYDWILVHKPDIQRLAKRFGLSYEQAEAKFTKFIPEYGY